MDESVLKRVSYFSAFPSMTDGVDIMVATMLQSLGGNCQTAISRDPIPLIKHS